MAIKNAAKFRAELFKNLEKACNFHSVKICTWSETNIDENERYTATGVTHLDKTLVFEDAHNEYSPYRRVIDKQLFITVCDDGDFYGNIDLWHISEDGKYFELYAAVPTCLYTAQQMQMRAAILVETYFSK